MSGLHGELGRRGCRDQVPTGRRAPLWAGGGAGAQEGAGAFWQTHQRNVGGEVQRDGARSREGTAANGSAFAPLGSKSVGIKMVNRSGKVHEKKFGLRYKRLNLKLVHDSNAAGLVYDQEALKWLQIHTTLYDSFCRSWCSKFKSDCEEYLKTRLIWHVAVQS